MARKHKSEAEAQTRPRMATQQTRRAGVGSALRAISTQDGSLRRCGPRRRTGGSVCASRGPGLRGGLLTKPRPSDSSAPAPQGARAGPARRQPFPGSSPLLSSGPRAPRAAPQGCARSRARALQSARPLSARSAARRRGSHTLRTRLAALAAAENRPAKAGPRFPARRRSGSPNLRPQGDGGGKETGPGGRRTWWS